MHWAKRSRTPCSAPAAWVTNQSESRSESYSTMPSPRCSPRKVTEPENRVRVGTGPRPLPPSREDRNARVHDLQVMVDPDVTLRESGGLIPPTSNRWPVARRRKPSPIRRSSFLPQREQRAMLSWAPGSRSAPGRRRSTRTRLALHSPGGGGPREGGGARAARRCLALFAEELRPSLGDNSESGAGQRPAPVRQPASAYRCLGYRREEINQPPRVRPGRIRRKAGEFLEQRCADKARPHARWRRSEQRHVGSRARRTVRPPAPAGCAGRGPPRSGTLQVLR